MSSVSDNLKKWWDKHSAKEFHFFKASPSPATPDVKLNGSMQSSPLGPFEATDAMLGEGGYAKVVLGRHRETGEKVAIKLLDTRQEQNAGRATSSEAAIVREVAALRRAGQHPNVCGLLGYYRLGENGACHAMVMELCRGGELFRLVEKFGAMDEERIRPIFLGVLAGVQHLHSVGIAHRDLKLENILLAQSADGQPDDTCVPKIVDLGLAHCHARAVGSLTNDGWADKELTQFCGSRSYCAPEVMARLGYNGYQADVWSLGVCLFGLVSGFFPVDEATNRDWRYERLARQQHVAPDQSTCSAIFGFYSRPCPLSPSLVQLLDGMLQIAPAKRWTVRQIAASAWANGQSLAPNGLGAAAPATLPVEDAKEMSMSVEVDVSDFLERSTSGAGEMYVERSCAGGGGGGAAVGAAVPGAAPPMICRQKAEESVGVMVH